MKALFRRVNWIQAAALILFVGGVSLLVRTSIDAEGTPAVGRENTLTYYNANSLKSIPIERVASFMRKSRLRPLESILKVDMAPNLPQTVPIDWQYGYGDNRNPNYQLHAWHMVDYVLQKYMQTGQKDQLKIAYDIALDWISKNRVKRTNSQVKNMAWYDMAVGLRVYRLAYILDAVLRADIGDRKAKQELWVSLVDHLIYLKNDQNIAFKSNHGLYEAAGQLAAARRFQGVSHVFTIIREQAHQRLNRMIGHQFTSEGVHKEHSPGYHKMVYSTVLNMRREGLIGSEKDGMLAEAGDALYWMTDPSGYIVNFGDTHEYKLDTNSSHLLNKDSKVLEYYVSGGKTGTKPTTQKLYKKSGFAAVKDEASYLALQAAFYSTTHKHADNLTIVWHEKDRAILVDAGQYGYVGPVKINSDDWRKGFIFSDPKRQYVEKTRAHNTVEIDGRDFLRRGAKPFGSAIRDGGIVNGTHYILSETEEFDTIRFQRLLLYRPGEWLIVADGLDDSKRSSHAFKQWFHFDRKLSLVKTADGFSSVVDGNKLKIKSLTQGTKRIGPIQGQTSPHLQGWYSPSLGKLVSNPAVAFTANGSRAQLVTLFTFGEEEVDYKKGQEGLSGDVTLSDGGTTNLLKFAVGKDRKVELTYK